MAGGWDKKVRVILQRNMDKSCYSEVVDIISTLLGGSVGLFNKMALFGFITLIRHECEKMDAASAVTLGLTLI